MLKDVGEVAIRVKMDEVRTLRYQKITVQGNHPVSEVHADSGLKLYLSILGKWKTLKKVGKK